MASDTSRSRTIEAGPQEIWGVLADFGALSTWVENVDHSCVLAHHDSIGLARRVQIGRNTLVETITEFTAPTELAYDIAGLPAKFGRVGNRWTLTPGPTASTVVTLTSTADIGSSPQARLAERVISRVLAGQSAAMLAGLAKRVERQHV